MSQVALITGGSKSIPELMIYSITHISQPKIASGMGLDVARQLSETGDWQVNIVGSNQQRSLEAMSSLANTIYHQADVHNYEQLANVYESIHNKTGRLDVVFANAGIAGTTDFSAAIPRREYRLSQALIRFMLTWTASCTPAPGYALLQPISRVNYRIKEFDPDI
jgi:NAD(P)-dependent dehydrogenase (short-subunit alcohol dehydrogenase family)